MFQTQIQSQSFVLQSEMHQVEVLPFGAILNRYAVLQNGQWRNIIAGFHDNQHAKRDLVNGFRSAKLSPFACRLNESAYQFENKQYFCQKHVLNGHAIHGLMYDAEFGLQAHGADNEAAWLILSANYQAENTGFPFEYQLIVQYRLDKNGLQIQTTARNTGSHAMPLVDGWHPYFTFGKKVDDYCLQINANQMLEFNQDLLPTGKTLPESRFQAAQSLQGIELDNSFVLNQNHEAACVLQNDDFVLKIFAEQHYPYLQIYIPPERDCIAIENLSGAPDCFNNGLGLSILQAGEEKSFITRYDLKLKEKSK